MAWARATCSPVSTIRRSPEANFDNPLLPGFVIAQPLSAATNDINGIPLDLASVANWPPRGQAVGWALRTSGKTGIPAILPETQGNLDAVALENIIAIRGFNLLVRQG